MTARHLALVLVLVSLAGCGRGHLFYDARELRHAPFLEKDRRALVQQAGAHLGNRTLRVDGRAVNARSFGRLPISVLGAVFLVTALNDRGGENDLRVHVGRRRVPVSTYAALDGQLVVETGPADSPADPLRPEEIAAAVLSPRELSAVRDLRYARKPRSPDGDMRRAAFYEARGCRGTITLYASGARTDKYRFIGDVRAPRNAVLHSIVHELGHAFEAADARERYCAADGQSVARANPLIREGNAMLTEGPVIRAYRALGAPAPTDYGATSIHESFAESFALFHVDPDALRRARPGVYAWFARGGHISARRPLR